MGASPRNNVLPGCRIACQRALRRQLILGLITAGNNDHRHARRGTRRGDRRAISLESVEVIGHRMKALRLAPERLHERMDLRWELPHFPNEAFKRSRSGRTKDFDKPTGNTWSATGQERQTRTHDANMRQRGSQLRQRPPASQHAGTFRCHAEPVRRWIDQDQAGNPFGMTRAIRAHNEAAKRMADEHAWFSKPYAFENGTELIDDAFEGSGTRRGLAPPESGSIVGTDPCECRNSREDDGPTERRSRYARFEQHWWAAVPRTYGMQSVPADVNEMSRRGELSALTARTEPLVQESAKEQQNNDR